MAELTTGGLLLLVGAVMTVVGILFFPFLCIGVSLLIIGIIVIVSEGGQITKPGPYGYPGYAPQYPYAPMPPQAPISPGSVGPPSGTPGMGATTRFCANCGSALLPSAAFCSKCGAKVLG